jgi:hypothetical protein
MQYLVRFHSSINVTYSDSTYNESITYYPHSSMIAQTTNAIEPNRLEQIQTKVQTFSPEQQQQVLDFVEFLAQKHQPPVPQKSIWEKIRDCTAQIPDEEWEKMPTEALLHLW